MDRRYMKKAIHAGEMRLFAGTQLTIPAGKAMLLDEFKNIFDSILKDQKRITPNLLTSVVSYVVPTAKGLEIGFGMIPSPQGEIGKVDGETLDEHAVREMENRLALCVKIASNGITRGNELALTAEEAALYAEDVQNKLADADDERIAREVAKRARGNLTLFELPTGPEEIGGQHNVPTYFPARQNLRLRSCQVVGWPTQSRAILALPASANCPSVGSLVRDGKLKVRVAKDSQEALLLKCADLSRILFDVDVNLGEDLSPKKVDPAVMLLHEPERILEEARIRIVAAKDIAVPDFVQAHP